MTQQSSTIDRVPWLAPPRLVALIFAGMALSHFLTPLPVIASPWRWLGVFIVAGGLLIVLSVAQRFAAARIEINTFRRPNRLVVDGLFSFSRNPIYLGFFLMLLGAAIAFGSLIGFVGPLIFFLVADAWYIPTEEHNAELVFGDEYRAYWARVRRWI